MPKLDLSKLYKSQISQTEWLSAIGHDHAEAFRAEDNDKRERLRRLQELTGLPYDRPHQSTARAVADRTSEFEAFLRKHGHELCAMRLIPTHPGLPKLRTRGLSIRDTLPWFAEQGIDPDHYRVDFVPHVVPRWSTIFIVNDHGAFGEIVRGTHTQLTQGFYEDAAPIQFRWDFANVAVSPDTPAAAGHIRDFLGRLRIAEPAVRARLSQELDAEFAGEYLKGYFETTDSDEFGLWYIDYNRILGRMYADFTGPTAGPATGPGQVLVRGQAGSAGQARGRVRVIDGPQAAQVAPDEILVCRVTTPEYLPLMQQAAAIVTDFGGILSHAAIVARELGKPCLTATSTATTTLKDGMLVIVDADAGVVRVP